MFLKVYLFHGFSELSLKFRKEKENCGGTVKSTIPERGIPPNPPFSSLWYTNAEPMPEEPSTIPSNSSTLPNPSSTPHSSSIAKKPAEDQKDNRATKKSKVADAELQAAISEAKSSNEFAFQLRAPIPRTSLPLLPEISSFSAAMETKQSQEIDALQAQNAQLLGQMKFMMDQISQQQQDPRRSPPPASSPVEDKIMQGFEMISRKLGQVGPDRRHGSTREKPYNWATTERLVKSMDAISKPLEGTSLFCGSYFF